MPNPSEIVKCSICKEEENKRDCATHVGCVFCPSCWSNVIDALEAPIEGEGLRARISRAVEKLLEKQLYIDLEESIRE